VIGKYLGLNKYSPKAKLGIWTFPKNVLVWGARPMLAKKSLMEFHFIKKQ